MTKSEIKKLREEIATKNNVKSSNILIFVKEDGSYYDWAFRPLPIREVK